MPVTPRAAKPTRSATARRLRLVVVGLAKTGTTSIAGIFGRYRAAHEFMFEETVKRISAWQRGKLSHEAFRRYVLERDAAGGLEVDSASFNHHSLDILAQELTDSKFIFSIRDCFSWFESIVAMGLRAEGDVPDWMMEYGRFVARDSVDGEAIASPLSLVAALPDLLEGLFRYWGEMNARVLSLLPPGRSLVLRTDQISDALDRLALFAGVPRDTLLLTASHRNRAPRKLDLLESLGQRRVAEAYHLHCRELMERVFPDLSWPSPGRGAEVVGRGRRVGREHGRSGA